MKQINSLLISIALLVAAPVAAQRAEFPTGDLDSRTVRVQAKAESLYQRGNYKRAHFIYANELARIGDKYAQYMMGYMYMMGHGVDADPVMASAWYRIAAERRIPEFMAVRDQFLQTLDDDQRARSDELYLELRNEFSDLAIIMGQLAEDLAGIRTVRTGSRLPGNTIPVMIVDPKTGVTMSADAARNRALKVAQARLDFVTTRLDIDPLKAEQASTQVEALWERVRDYLSVVDDETDGLYAAP